MKTKDKPRINATKKSDGLGAGKTFDVIKKVDVAVDTPYRVLHRAVLLDDGKSVLTVGGLTLTKRWAEQRAEGKEFMERWTTIDPILSSALFGSDKNEWAKVGSLSEARFDVFSAPGMHTATLLDNGKVLVCGGMSTIIEGNKQEDFQKAQQAALKTSEIYDPLQKKFSKAAPMNDVRVGHIAVKLLDGRVLVAGQSKTAELYDPAKDKWSRTGDLPQPTGDRPAATLLADGRVLVCGGWKGMSPTNYCSIYDLKSGKWSKAADTKVKRNWHTLATLLDGRVLVVGGFNGKQSGKANEDRCELYDPAKNEWTLTGSLNVGRYDTDAVQLPNGDVLVAGGACGANVPSTDTVEVYDVKKGTWKIVGKISQPRRSHTTTLMKYIYCEGKMEVISYRILLIGGWNIWFDAKDKTIPAEMWEMTSIDEQKVY